MSEKLQYQKDNIRYLNDNFDTRLELSKSFSNMFTYDFISSAYIEIDIKKRTYRLTLAFEWLYQEKPRIITIEELKFEMRKNKIKNLLNE